MCIYDQLLNHIDQIFSKCQFGFQKSFTAEQCLIDLIGQWKAGLDNKNEALLTDFSKALIMDYCVNHGLFIAKLHVYGLDFKSLKLIHSYLNKRKQKV